MSSAKSKDTTSLYKNQLYFYIPAGNIQKLKFKIHRLQLHWKSKKKKKKNDNLTNVGKIYILKSTKFYWEN